MLVQAFPADIVLEISELLCTPTVLNLRLVCHHIHDIVSPVALRNVYFSVGVGMRLGSEESQKVNRLLKSCSSPLPNLYQHGTHLRLSFGNIFCKSLYTLSNEDLLPNLWKTIAKMRSVTSLTLRWDISHYEGRQGMRNIPFWMGKMLDSLFEATGGKLERLSVEQWKYARNWFPEALSRFHGLKYLKIVRDPQGARCRPLRHAVDCNCIALHNLVALLITANTEIEEMEIMVGCLVTGFDPDLVLPPSLTKLTSLVVCGLDARKASPIQVFVDPTPLRNLRHLSTPSTDDYGPQKLDALWNSMRRANATLETLVTKQVSFPLIQYLASFYGLRSLEIHEIKDRPEYTSPEITSSFLSLVLPRHSGTLENLRISFSLTVKKPIIGWTLNRTNWASTLSQLTKLRSLHIYPPIDHSLPTYIPTTADLVRSYQSAIECVETLDSLEELNLEWVNMTWKWRHRMRMLAPPGIISEILKQVLPELVGRTGTPRLLGVYDGKHAVVMRQDGPYGEKTWGWNTEAN